MATLDLSNATASIDMADADLTGFMTLDLTFSGNWSWFTPDGNYVYASGSGMTYDAQGRALTGTVNSLTIDIGNNNSFAPDIVVTGIATPASALDDGPASFWSFLEGDDTIIGPSLAKVGANKFFNLFGDGIQAEPGSSTGGDDTIFHGDVNAQVFGDVIAVGSSANGAPTVDYRGGDDLIQGASTNQAQYLTGDAGLVYASGRLTGGHDRVIIQSSNFSNVSGDAGVVEGQQGDIAEVIGGDDMIFAGGNTDVTLTGDVNHQLSYSLVRGGNDTIDGGDNKDYITGDVFNSDGTGTELIGGADTIFGGGGDDAIVGEVYSFTGGVLKGGDDVIRGGFGRDIILGEVGNGGLNGVTGGDDRLYGEVGDDRLSGQTGNDWLEGGLGADELEGGSGSDTAAYAESSAGVTADLHAPSANTGDALGDSYLGIENLLGSAFADSLRGDDFVNRLSGGDGADALFGRGGNDQLIGGAGDDKLLGELGNDTFTGGSGRDSMTGGAGGDRFDFNALAESAIGAQRDAIQDFTVNPASGAGFVDRLDFSTIDARAGTAGNQAFAFIGASAFTAEGQIRAVQTGANTILQLNTAGANGAEMELTLVNFTASLLTAADFIL